MDIALTIMQYGFVISLIYFAVKSLKSVVDEIFDIDVNIIYWGVIVLFIAGPLCLVRRIEKFAFTYIFADILIFITAIMITVFAGIHLADNKKWGEGVELINPSTWLTMIGSSIYAFEGIGVVIPIIEVTENPKQFPKILLYVMLTNMILYTSFGEFNLFVYGNELNGKPLITMNLEKGWVVWLIKILFSINVIISISLFAFPANTIIESYMYKKLKNSLKKTWIINF